MHSAFAGHGSDGRPHGPFGRDEEDEGIHAFVLS
jgi:hypothetical protein